MRLSELMIVLDRIAPLRLAEAWDNVGLLAGDVRRKVTNVLLTIDYTPAVADEAKRLNCNCVISYHPPLFHAVKRLTAPHIVHDTIRRGVALYSPHTALDVAAGGTNDVLADVLQLGDRFPLRPSPTAAAHAKLVMFVPGDAAERVSRAVFAAGAGHIGNYSSCSFRSPGTGTFFGEQGAKPAVGQKGALEQVAELRLETLVPLAALPAVIQAMRRSHPYEEPAFDVVPLLPVPGSIGLGRVGTLPRAISLTAILGQIKRRLGLAHLLVAASGTGRIRRAAVAAGACGDLLDDAIAHKVDLLLTGEMRHHDALRAAGTGLTVVCTLHSNSERIALKHLRNRLAGEVPGVKFLLSRSDRDPFAVR